MSSADRMIWYKAWTDTRRYFVSGITILFAMVLALYMSYPGDPGKEFPHGAIAVGVDQVRALAQDARSYIWLHWFGTTLLLYLSCLAIAVAGTGFAPAASGGSKRGYYLMSMPVSRRKLASIRIALGLAELGVAAVIPSLLVSAMALTVGQIYSPMESMMHALLAVAGVTAFYGLFVLLSAMLGELSKAVAGIAILFLYGMFTFLIDGVRQRSIFRLMTGDTYFLCGEVPWLAIAACVSFGLICVFGALTIVDRRDY